MSDNIISCGIVPYVISSGKQQFLIVQSKSGFWGFPKGHQEPGESIIETAKRELKEEVGIVNFKLAKPISPIEVQYNFNSGGERVQKSIYYFLAKLSSKTVKLQTTELESYKWVYINELALFLGESYFDMITFLHKYFKLI